MSDSLQVWLETEFLTDKLQIGTLTHDRSAIRFAYDPSWLQHPLSFAIAYLSTAERSAGVHSNVRDRPVVFVVLWGRTVMPASVCRSCVF